MRERGRIHALASEYVRCEYVSEKNEEKEHVKRSHFFLNLVFARKPYV